MLVSYEILPDDALAFIFQADRDLSDAETEAIEEKLHTFIAGWTSHQLPVNGFGKIYHHRFIVIFADESDDKIGGCSKDKVSHFIHQMGEQYHINFFDRLQVAYLDGDAVKTVALAQLGEALETGQIALHTPLFNNLVPTKVNWETSWKQPLLASPFSRYVIQKAD